ncbi:MAG TPA: TetR/AcrR family transcriptional regulator [Solirubrobacteraceae bacterium]|jgi:AcrR family transcriptional regulator|nr:TetR/AcrR family transcriptional regulator [Solirubrobacteraceae bacterium]
MPVSSSALPGTSSALAGSRLAGRVLPRAQVDDIQRSRLLAGAVAAIDELGYEGATVGKITGRARVSRRTFYELFAGRDECLAAVLEDVVAQVEAQKSSQGPRIGRDGPGEAHIAWRRIGAHSVFRQP